MCIVLGGGGKGGCVHCVRRRESGETWMCVHSVKGRGRGEKWVGTIGGFWSAWTLV